MFTTFIASLFATSILFSWAVLFISLEYFTQGLVQGGLTTQGLAQMVSLLPAPQDTASAKSTLNNAIGTLTKGASPHMSCQVTNYQFIPANSNNPNATVQLTTACKVATLAFGTPTLSRHQDIAVFYAHVIS